MSTNERWYIVNRRAGGHYLMHMGSFRWSYLWWYGPGAGQPPVYATRHEALHVLYALADRNDGDAVVDGDTFDALVAMAKARCAVDNA